MTRLSRLGKGTVIAVVLLVLATAVKLTLVYAYRDTGGLFTEPLLSADGSVIYVGSRDHNLYAFYTDCTLKWKYQTGNEILGPPAVAPPGSPNAGSIYIGSTNKTFYAVSEAGALMWSYVTPDQIHASAAIDPTDGTVYIANESNDFYAFYPNTPGGPIKWQMTMPVKQFRWKPMILVSGGVLLGSNNGGIYKVDTSSHTVTWSFDTSSPYTAGAVLDGTALYASGGPGVATKVIKVTLDAGSATWSTATDDGSRTQPRLSPDKSRVYLGQRGSSKLHAYQSSDGVEQWAFPGNEHMNATAAVHPSTGVIYAGSVGAMYGINPDGSQLWARTDVSIRSTAAISANGNNVYIGDEVRTFWVLNATTGATVCSYDIVNPPAPPSPGNPQPNRRKNVSLINGVPALTGAGNTGTGSLRVTIATDQSQMNGFGTQVTGGELPLNARLFGVRIGGLLQSPTSYVCSSSAVYGASTSGSTQLVSLSTTGSIIVCRYELHVGATATSVKLVYGTGTNCATSPTDLTPAWQIAANGARRASGVVTVPTNSALCLNTSAGNPVQAVIQYVKL